MLSVNDIPSHPKRSIGIHSYTFLVCKSILLDVCFPCLTVRLFPSSWHLQSRDHRSLKRESLGRCPVVVSSTEHKYCLRVNPVSIRTLGFVSDWVRVGVVELGSENSDPFTTVNPIPRGT